jgi:glycosyltransferase involved in cell wall biosynthesis
VTFSLARRCGAGRELRLLRMRISVVLSTYDRPRDLALVLAGYALQDDRDFELVVADDGSGPETARVVEDAARRSAAPIRHVWQPDRGFRKTEILDRAVGVCAGAYLVFSDGDCIPRADFISTHRRLAARGRFLSGGYMRLPAALGAALAADDVRAGWIWRPAELRRRGLSARSALRLLPAGPVPELLDRLTPTRATWNGMNASTWKDAVVAVNGFELDLGYGGEDREFGERLVNLGLVGRQVRHRAVLLHLEHTRPYRDAGVASRQRTLRDEVRRSGRTRAVRGIAELSVEPTTTSRETRP